ncbi:MAG: hypothetical protein LDL44_00675, partial [Caenispirillum sp.]|nr:hypothetical protein [Caenispirillum sp.]
MTNPLPSGMAEAARLTRDGKLADATALIRRLLHGEPASPPPTAQSAPVIDAEYVTVDAPTQKPQPQPQPAPSNAGRPRRTPGAGLGETLRRLAKQVPR